MYAQHFGLEHEPFSIAPDPRYLYMSERHREALAHLLYGLGAGGGVVLLTGEIGAGKTTVFRCFLDQVPAHCQVAYVFNPKLNALELMASVCEEFGVAVPDLGPGATIKTYLDPLNRFLLGQHAAGRNSVLVIDEAQLLPAEVLEQLRLLTNLETSERKLLQIVLIGQPELRGLLAAPGLVQLAQRVVARYHLDALDATETGLYLQHRLAVAGLRGPSPLPAALVPRIHRLTGGVPRRINLLCDRALLGAFAQGLAAVDRKTLDRAAKEIAVARAGEGPAAAWTPGRALGLGLGLGVALTAAVAVWVGGWGGGSVGSSSAGSGLGSGSASASASASRPGSSTASGAGAAPGLVVGGASSAGGAPPAVRVPAVAAPVGAASGPRVVGVAGSAPGMGSAVPVGAAVAFGPASASASAATPTLAQQAPAAGAEQALNLSEDEAWRRLTAQWGAPLDTARAVEPCAVAAKAALACHRSAGGLADVRDLNRPVILVLRADRAARPRHAVLLGLGPTQALLSQGEGQVAVPLDELAQRWRGEFITVLRSVDGAPDARQARPGEPMFDRLARLLGRASGVAQRPAPTSRDELRNQVIAFQLSQGLKPDGRPGPLTLIALNRAAGEREPTLSTLR